jgi:hypothetical protein
MKRIASALALLLALAVPASAATTVCLVDFNNPSPYCLGASASSPLFAALADGSGHALSSDLYGSAYYLHVDPSTAASDGATYGSAAVPQVNVGAGKGSDGLVHPIAMDAGGNQFVKSGIFASTGASQFGLSVATATSLTVPGGSLFAEICVETASVRYRDDGTAPTATVGIPVAVSTCFQYAGPLAAVQFIAQSGSPTIDVSYYK